MHRSATASVVAACLAIALISAIATIRLRYAGLPWAAIATKVTATASLILGVLCLLAMALTRTC